MRKYGIILLIVAVAGGAAIYYFMGRSGGGWGQSGRRTGADILLGYAAQLGWIVLALGGLALLWRRATRRYSAVGA